MVRRAIAAVAAIGATLLGCWDVDDHEFQCDDDTDCIEGYECRGICVAVGADRPDAGTDAESPTNGGSGEIDYAELEEHELLLQVEVDARCHARWECGWSGKSWFRDESLVTFESRAQCRQKGRDWFYNPSVKEELKMAVEAGRLSVDRSAVQDCRDEMNDYFCSGELTGAGCEEAFSGEVESSDHAVHSWSCSEGGLRMIEGNQGSPLSSCFGGCQDWFDCPASHAAASCEAERVCFKGDCEPPRGQGFSCTDERHCVFALECDGSERECVAPESVGDGEPCGEQLVQCEPGLTCVDGTCRQPLGEGDSCFRHDDCRYGYYCNSDHESAADGAGVCVPSKSMGESCGGASPAGVSDCFGGPLLQRPRRRNCPESRECETDVCDPYSGTCVETHEWSCRTPEDSEIEVAGVWETDEDTAVSITDRHWIGETLGSNETTIVIGFDNEDRSVIIETITAGLEPEYEYDRRVWTEPTDDEFYYCEEVSGRDTEEDARQAEVHSDETDLEGGCGEDGDPWTQMTRRPAGGG